MRYLIHFSYDGTNFCGFQKQPELRSVESEFERALSFDLRWLFAIIADML